MGKKLEWWETPPLKTDKAPVELYSVEVRNKDNPEDKRSPVPSD